MSCDQLHESYPVYEVVERNETKEGKIGARSLCEKIDKDEQLNIVVMENSCYASTLKESRTKDGLHQLAISSEFTSQGLNSKLSEYKKGKCLTALLTVSCLIIAFLVVILIIITSIGFTRISAKQSVEKLALNPELIQTSSPNKSVLSTSLTNCSGTDLIKNYNHLLTNSSYVYLQGVFDSNENLFGLLRDCVTNNNFSFSQCINLIVSMYGKHDFLPASSCRELYTLVPNNSGYYWVTASDGSIIQVYCEMTMSCGNITGGLTRIATINSETRSQYCTGEIQFDCSGCKRTSPLPGCSRILFPVMKLSYTDICGIASGSFFGTVDGFLGSGRPSPTINDNYVDGISLTYGGTSNRTHIWTFIPATGDCSIGVPPYVGIHFSCFTSNTLKKFQRDFMHTLTEDIEVRLCQDQHRETDNEGIFLSRLDIYIY